MKLMRSVADIAEDTFDIHVFRRESAARWPETEFAKQLFRTLAPDCVFDVGANIGQYGRQLREIFAGTILSFEPVPAAFEKLMGMSSDDPDWHCFPYALGSSNSRQRINVTARDDFASLLMPAQSARDHFPDHVEIADTPEIEIRTLESVYPELQSRFGFSNPFLKMDTQGFDLEVVKGSDLNRFCGLVSEVAITALYEDAPTIETSIAAFRQRDFVPVGLFNVHPSNALREVIECNCYCARKDLVKSYD